MASRGGGVAGTLFLLLHLSVESGLVSLIPCSRSMEFGEVKGNPCVIKQDASASAISSEPLARCSRILPSSILIPLSRCGGRIFFLLDYLFDKFFLCRKFGGRRHPSVPPVCRQTYKGMPRADRGMCIHTLPRGAEYGGSHIRPWRWRGAGSLLWRKKWCARGRLRHASPHRFLVLSIFLSGSSLILLISGVNTSVS